MTQTRSGKITSVYKTEKNGKNGKSKRLPIPQNGMYAHHLRNRRKIKDGEISVKTTNFNAEYVQAILDISSDKRMILETFNYDSDGIVGNRDPRMISIVNNLYEKYDSLSEFEIICRVMLIALNEEYIKTMNVEGGDELRDENNFYDWRTMQFKFDYGRFDFGTLDDENYFAENGTYYWKDTGFFVDDIPSILREIYDSNKASFKDGKTLYDALCKELSKIILDKINDKWYIKNFFENMCKLKDGKFHFDVEILVLA